MDVLEKFGPAIGVVRDFPLQGIVFRDVSPLLRDAKLREEAYDALARHYIDNNIKVDLVAGIESRGFIFGTALAARLNCGFIMVRKPSKLPGKIVSVDYGLEYGKNTLCLQEESIKPKQNVLIVDDLLASGGTAEAATKLIKQLDGNVVGACFLIELDGLDGRKKLSNIPVFSLLTFPVDGSDVKAPEKKEAPKEEKKEKSQEEKKKEEEALENDRRAVVVFYPSMEEIAKNLCKVFPDKFRLGSVSWAFFPDGWPDIRFEHMKFLEGRHVVFLGSLYDRTKLVEQLSLMMVLPRQFVHSLDIVFPYFAPATMERVDEEGILATAETVAKLVTSSIPMTRTGPASLRIFDIHALPVRFYFPDNVMVRLMSAIPLLINELSNSSGVVVCFPDDGAAKRFKKDFAKFPIIICAKVREGDKRIVKVTDELNFTSNTKLDHVIIVDDLVQSGGTLYECRKALLAHGAKMVSAFVTHPIFPNQGYKRFFESGDRHGFETFYVTNTVPEVAAQVEGHKPFKVLRIEHMLAQDVEKLAR